MKYPINGCPASEWSVKWLAFIITFALRWHRLMPIQYRITYNFVPINSLAKLDADVMVMMAHVSVVHVFGVSIRRCFTGVRLQLD